MERDGTDGLSQQDETEGMGDGEDGIDGMDETEQTD